MIWFIVKSALSGLLIATIAEIARRSPAFAALVASLPLVSILAMLWMRHDGASDLDIARHAQATFWYVMPSLPMFLILPALVRSGRSFEMSLMAGVVVTILLYGLMMWLGPRFGLRL